MKNAFFRLFGRKSREVSALIFRYFANTVKWTPRTFTALAEEGFEKNVWVYRCVSQTARSVARVPWLLYQRRGDGSLKEITKHPLLDLINKPNPLQSGQEWREAYIAFMLLAGNSYALKVGPKSSPPRELWNLRPDRVEIIPDRYNYVKGYKYTIDSINGVE